jgi:pimeloyl-ACP methyl ester carboxylesterase
MTPDAWRAQGDVFDWRGERIFFRAAGRGEPVVLIHGFPTASWDWAPLWPALTERYRVMALDMIGFGFSAKPRDFAYSIFAQADLFGALLAREQVTRYHLVAHDYGLTVAQELLARERDGAADHVGVPAQRRGVSRGPPPAVDPEAPWRRRSVRCSPGSAATARSRGRSVGSGAATRCRTPSSARCGSWSRPARGCG